MRLSTMFVFREYAKKILDVLMLVSNYQNLLLAPRLWGIKEQK